MARPLRVNVEKGWYHAMHRRFERGVIFKDDKHRRHFLDLVGSLEESLGIPVHGLCLDWGHVFTINI